MKKLLFFTSFAIIGCQSALAMEMMHSDANPQSPRERAAYRTRQEPTREEQARVNRHHQEVRTGWGHQAAHQLQDLYGIIGVNRNATTAQISSAYRRRSLELKKSGDQEEMKRLNHAKDVLTDFKARAAYDNELERVD